MQVSVFSLLPNTANLLQLLVYDSPERGILFSAVDCLSRLWLTSDLRCRLWLVIPGQLLDVGILHVGLQANYTEYEMWGFSKLGSPVGSPPCKSVILFLGIPRRVFGVEGGYTIYARLEGEAKP